ncbi:hypothetical protein CDD82_4657 [Ophiocordyceps australis]|uniref:Uncharacterized protein n=1 Tax=Ophiocordyceps australis TaxID=1399860 RepID=A0A2C5ZNU8_9HYPO|nr:hypothetical protein CDD82_4657 [Ophiocordyceps australis]
MQLCRHSRVSDTSLPDPDPDSAPLSARLNLCCPAATNSSSHLAAHPALPTNFDPGEQSARIRLQSKPVYIHIIHAPPRAPPPSAM